MAENTVAALANTLKVDVERLLSQMKEAGIDITDADAAVSAEDKKTLLAFLKKSHGESATQPKKITLKRKTTSTLKTTGSGGKSKTVNVEVRKKRTYVQRSVIDEQAAKEAEEKAAQEAALAQAQAEKEAAEAKAQAEKEAAQAEQARIEAEKAAQEAAQAQAEAEAEEAKASKPKSIAEQAESIKKDAARRAAEAKAKAERDAAAKKKTPTAKKVKSTNSIIERAAKLEEEAKKRAAEASKTNQIDEAAKQAAEEKAAKETAKLAEKYKDANVDDAPSVDDSPVHKSSIVQDAFEKSMQEEARTIKRGRDAKASKKRVAGSESISHDKTLKRSKFMKGHGFTAPTEKQTKVIEIGEFVKIADLAQKLSIKANELVKALFKMGEMVTINQSIDHETAQLIVEEYGHQIKVVSETALEDALVDTISRDDETLKPRAPVVTIMGHVDHGKTSLLDYIRKAHVADGEAGGITQHIGAYHVETEKGMITFLDTPGHAAFTAMRARGAKATDIVIVVVAADDGVMPQTKEAIEHSKAAGVPIIIAVNKMDKEQADVERVKSELAAIDVVPEDWGGEYQFMPVSAHSGQGVEDLLETVLMNAELLELKAHDSGTAEGVVIEARLEKGRGAVASLLVQDGELTVGNMVLAGDAYGRVRAMHDENGKPIKSAGPSIPVEILGLNGVPDAGDGFMIVKDERKAKEVAAFREAREREQRLARQKASKLENLFANMGKDEASMVNIVLKTDVRGSLEAIIGALNDLSTDEVRVDIISSGVGGINESDVNLAMTSGAVILGFNVRADSPARKLCEEEGIDLRYYSIIYEMIDDVKAAMSGLLAPERKEEIVGIAEVREVFRSSKFGTAAGCIVSEGTIFRNEPIRVLRDNVVIFEGELESLRRFKDDVNEVKKGIECGIGVKGYNDIKEGDLIEVFKITEVKRTL